MEEKYMTPVEVMAYLRVGKNTLLKFRRLGLPFVKITRKVVYRRSDIDRFMEAHLVAPIRPPAGVRKPKRKGRREGR